MNNDRLQRQVDSVDDQVTDTFNELIQEVEELESEKDDLENQLSTLEERVRDLEYENEELTSYKNSLEEDVVEVLEVMSPSPYVRYRAARFRLASPTELKKLEIEKMIEI